MAADSFEKDPQIDIVPPLDRFVEDWNKTTYPVEVKMIFIRHLADVDTINQSFKIAVGFDMMWPSTSIDKKNWKKDAITFKPEYIPNFEFPNAKESNFEKRALENGNPYQIQEVDGVQYNFLRTFVELTCIERLELQAFPFDVQELTLTMDMTFAPVQKAMFVPSRGIFPKPDNDGAVPVGASEVMLSTADFNSPNLILNRQYCTIPDFDVERCVVQFCNTCYAGEEHLVNDTFRWSQVVIRFQIKRRAEGYLYRVGFYNLLLAYTSMCTFALSPTDDLGDRIGFLITLILAAVAFQFIVSQYLPNVSYLTILDKYTFIVFTICCILLGTVSFIGVVDVSDEQRVLYDRWCLYIYLIALTLVQVLFWVYGLRAREKQMEHFKMGELELKKVNYLKIDTPITVGKGGLLKESQKPMKASEVCAFVSFDGVSDAFNE